jgi:hypothetical protein
VIGGIAGHGGCRRCRNNNGKAEVAMEAESLYGLLRIVSIAVLLIMIVAACYSGYMAIMHWTGIGV